MRRVSTRIFLVLSALAFTATAASAADAVKVELNALEDTDAGCRISFLMENAGSRTLETLRTELAVFNRAGTIQRRMLVDLGPLRHSKTIVKSFVTEQKCDQIGSLLVNDVSVCTPLERDACIDALQLTSRVEDVRLYK